MNMGKHMIYTCDRCHEESKQRRAQVNLPTGKLGVLQMWDLCKTCLDEHTKLIMEQAGQLRAFVAGVELPREADANQPAYQSAMQQQAGSWQQSPLYGKPRGY